MRTLLFVLFLALITPNISDARCKRHHKKCRDRVIIVVPDSHFYKGVYKPPPKKEVKPMYNRPTGRIGDATK